MYETILSHYLRGRGEVSMEKAGCGCGCAARAVHGASACEDSSWDGGSSGRQEVGAAGPSPWGRDVEALESQVEGETNAVLVLCSRHLLDHKAAAAVVPRVERAATLQ